MGKRAVKYKGSKLWNNLPTELRDTLSVIGVGMGRSRAQVQIWEVIVSDFIRDTDYFENKAIARSAQTLA